MTELQTVVALTTAIGGMLITILTMLVRATIKWTIVTSQLTTITNTVNDLTSKLVDAVTKDNDHETRLQLLERGK